MNLWEIKKYNTQEKIEIVMLQTADIIESYYDDIIELYKDTGGTKIFDIQREALLEEMNKERQNILDNFNTCCIGEVVVFAILLELEIKNDWTSYDYDLTPDFKILNEIL